MPTAVPRPARLALVTLVSLLALGAAPAALAKPLDLYTIFTSAPRATTLSAEQILRRALDNLFDFDSAIVLEIERRTAGGAPEISEFMMQRARRGNSRRLLTVSMQPDAVRGNRVLQVNYDDGREETFAFVPGMGSSPVRTPYRLGEPFLAMWYEIGPGEPSDKLRTLAEYEVLAFAPVVSAGEAAYEFSLRSIVPRGYDRTELIVARSDYAILEQRHYMKTSSVPALTAEAPRRDMVRFGDHIVPGHITYREAAGATIEVTIQHSPLPEGSEPLLFPTTFHRMPLPSSEGAPTPSAEPTEPR